MTLQFIIASIQLIPFFPLIPILPECKIRCYTRALRYGIVVDIDTETMDEVSVAGSIFGLDVLPSFK